MERSSVVSDRAGTRLFEANRISNDAAVLHAQTSVEEKRLLAGRGSDSDRSPVSPHLACHREEQVNGEQSQNESLTIPLKFDAPQPAPWIVAIGALDCSFATSGSVTVICAPRL